MRKKIIGISQSCSEKYNYTDMGYVNSIAQAGGLPVSIPPSDDLDLATEYIDSIDGLILSGGVDVSPFLYGENPHPKTQIPNNRRDDFELELLRLAVEKKMEILGICRGFQLINVFFGGSLIQHYKEQRPHALEHDKPEYQASYHWIDVDSNSRIYDIFGEDKIIVNSIHHQMIDQLAENLRCTATSEDGTIEVFEAEHILGVQFHPERLHHEEPFHNVFVDFLGRIK